MGNEAGGGEGEMKVAREVLKRWKVGVKNLRKAGYSIKEVKISLSEYAGMGQLS